MNKPGFVIRHSSLALALSYAALMAGCALGPNYKRPAVESPDSYRFAAGQTTNCFGDLPWWQVFKDPVLQDLIHTSLTNNYDLRKAVARVEQARQQAIAARAPLFPQVGYNGAVGRGRNATFNSPSGLNGMTESSALATLNATWEIDIWGRIRRLSQAARAQYLATDEARRGVMITLVSDMAGAYFQLLQYDQELQIQRAATNAYSGTYRIFNEKRIQGVSSRLDVTRPSTRAQLW